MEEDTNLDEVQEGGWKRERKGEHEGGREVQTGMLTGKGTGRRTGRRKEMRLERRTDRRTIRGQEEFRKEDTVHKEDRRPGKENIQ